MRIERTFMNKLSTEEYNSIPVLYCKKCLSLKVMNLVGMEDFDYCDECGTTDIGETDIETWKKFYKERYGFNYLDRKLK